MPAQTIIVSHAESDACSVRLRRLGRWERPWSDFVGTGPVPFSPSAIDLLCCQPRIFPGFRLQRTRAAERQIVDRWKLEELRTAFVDGWCEAEQRFPLGSPGGKVSRFPYDIVCDWLIHINQGTDLGHGLKRIQFGKVDIYSAVGQFLPYIVRKRNNWKLRNNYGIQFHGLNQVSVSCRNSELTCQDTWLNGWRIKSPSLSPYTCHTQGCGPNSAKPLASTSWRCSWFRWGLYLLPLGCLFLDGWTCKWWTLWPSKRITASDCGRNVIPWQINVQRV